ncbi:SRPBCC family protein [Mucilaginibacter phyllosphaerae]
MEHNERTIVSVRTFDTTTDKMLDAWTDPEKLASWWGPKGFSNTFQEFDPKPGGNWIFTMHGPDGADYPNESVFVEVGPGRIILNHINAPIFKLTATFEPIGNQTKLVFEQEFETADIYEKVKHICVPANEENFDRLETVLGINQDRDI